MELAQNINWSPEHIKEGRFGNWLEGARLVNLKMRFWRQSPIWRCKCGEMKVFDQLRTWKSERGKITDIHKHIVDKITFPVREVGEMNACRMF